jgi:hypothetical protein
LSFSILNLFRYLFSFWQTNLVTFIHILFLLLRLHLRELVIGLATDAWCNRFYDFSSSTVAAFASAISATTYSVTFALSITFQPAPFHVASPSTATAHETASSLTPGLEGGLI